MNEGETVGGTIVVGVRSPIGKLEVVKTGS
jgi:hypothetical protein